MAAAERRKRPAIRSIQYRRPPTIPGYRSLIVLEAKTAYRQWALGDERPLKTPHGEWIVNPGAEFLAQP